jgi:CheY-like chemotaxis protein
MQPTELDRSIIVADDSVIIRGNVRVALGDHWRIFLAANGVEALECARGVKAELVLLDFRMPRLDGVAACSEIRRLPHYATVPIVMLTAYDSVDLRRRAAQAGATAVFPKPFSPDALREGVLPLIAVGRDAARSRTRLADSGLDTVFSGGDALSANREMLSAQRRIEAAAGQHNTGKSFVELMAERRGKPPH